MRKPYNQRHRREQRRKTALTRFTINATKYDDPKDQAKYLERKAEEKASLEKPLRS